MKTFFNHLYWIIRYGEWNIGWEWYKGKPKFGLYFGYYNGHIICFHFFKFWIMVEY